MNTHTFSTEPRKDGTSRTTAGRRLQWFTCTDSKWWGDEQFAKATSVLGFVGVPEQQQGSTSPNGSRSFRWAVEVAHD